VLGTVQFLITCIAIKVVVCVGYSSVPDSVHSNQGSGLC
jgi:hypothetical protein